MFFHSGGLLQCDSLTACKLTPGVYIFLTIFYDVVLCDLNEGQCFLEVCIWCAVLIMIVLFSLLIALVRLLTFVEGVLRIDLKFVLVPTVPRC